MSFMQKLGELKDKAALKTREAGIRYGLFCADTEFAMVPAVVFFTRYAASRRCRELNRRSGRQWVIRTLE
jgi:hypothetical protein